MGRILAGAARRKLEPPIGLAMMGYGGRVGNSAGVHDELAVQALVLGDGRRKLAIASVDLLAMGKRICDAIAAEVAARCDLPADAIMICSTHTHSAPLFNIHATPRPDAKLGGDRDLTWERALPGTIADAIVAANDSLEPTQIRAARGRFTLGAHRRVRRPDGSIQLAANNAGVADAEVNALGIYRPDESAIAVVMNYPCHGVVLCEDNLLYSRDWPGFAQDKVERAMRAPNGGALIAMFIQGATGNIDPRSRGSFAVAAEEGATMARAVLDALAGAPPVETATLAARRIPLRLGLLDRSATIAVAKAYVEQTAASLHNHRGGEGYQLKRLKDHQAQAQDSLRVLEALDEANRRDRRVDSARGEIESQMSIFTLGDIAIVGIPGELFVELGLAIRANPWFAHTLVAGYCNDLVGYLPTREAYAEGGYEVETARVAAGSGEAIVARALEELRAIHEASAAAEK